MSDYDIINILKQDIAKEDYRSFYRHIKDEKIFNKILELEPTNKLYSHYFTNLKCLKLNLAFDDKSPGDCDDLLEIAEKILLNDITP
jgi:hypothetical protein